MGVCVCVYLYIYIYIYIWEIVATHLLTHTFQHTLIKIHMDPTKLIWDPHDLVRLMWILTNQKECVEKCVIEDVLLAFLYILLTVCHVFLDGMCVYCFFIWMYKIYKYLLDHILLICNTSWAFWLVSWTIKLICIILSI